MSQQTPQGLHDPEVQKQIIATVKEWVKHYLARVREVVQMLHKIREITTSTAYQIVITDLQKRGERARDEDVKKMTKIYGMQIYYNTISPVESYLVWIYDELLHLRMYITALSDVLAQVAPNYIIVELRNMYAEINRLAKELINLSHNVTDTYVYMMKPVFEIKKLAMSDAPDLAYQALERILGGQVRPQP